MPELPIRAISATLGPWYTSSRDSSSILNPGGNHHIIINIIINRRGSLWTFRTFNLVSGPVLLPLCAPQKMVEPRYFCQESGHAEVQTLQMGHSQGYVFFGANRFWMVHTLMIYQGTKNWRLQAHLVIRGTIKIIKKGGNNDEHPQLRASLDMFRLLWSILLRFNGGAWIPDNVRAFCNARNSYRFCILCSAALGILLTFGFSCALFDKPLWTCDFQVAAMPCPSGVPVPLLREIQSDAPEKWMPKIIQSWRFWLGKPMLWGCLVYPYIWEKPIWSQQWSNHGA